MPKGNTDNLTHKLTREEKAKGGRNSGKARSEASTIRKIGNEILSSSCSDIPKLKRLCEKLGVASDLNIKSLMVMVCFINTLKDGKITDLQKLAELLGEQFTDEEHLENDGFLEALKGEATEIWESKE